MHILKSGLWFLKNSQTKNNSTFFPYLKSMHDTIFDMEDNLHSVSWEAPEHNHIEKTSDWYWILGIVALAGAIVSIILNNVLFGIAIILGAFTMSVVSQQRPKLIKFEVSDRGIRIGTVLYPYATLESYFLDEGNMIDPQLIVKSKKLLMMLLIIPVPVDHITEIESIVNFRLPEEHLVEPLSHRLLEFFGF